MTINVNATSLYKYATILSFIIGWSDTPNAIFDQFNLGAHGSQEDELVPPLIDKIGLIWN